MGQDVSTSPLISIDDVVFEAIDHFLYMGSTITKILSLNMETDKSIPKAATVIDKLSKRVLYNSQLALRTKLKVFQTCVLSTLFLRQ